MLVAATENPIWRCVKRLRLYPLNPTKGPSDRNIHRFCPFTPSLYMGGWWLDRRRQEPFLNKMGRFGG